MGRAAKIAGAGGASKKHHSKAPAMTLLHTPSPGVTVSSSGWSGHPVVGAVRRRWDGCCTGAAPGPGDACLPAGRGHHQENFRASPRSARHQHQDEGDTDANNHKASVERGPLEMYLVQVQLTANVNAWSTEETGVEVIVIECGINQVFP